MRCTELIIKIHEGSEPVISIVCVGNRSYGTTFIANRIRIESENERIIIEFK